MLTAITREVSASINDCELSFHARQPIDVAKAIVQHKAYQDCLANLGVEVVSLPAEPELPDAVFVEDPAVVVDEVAVISVMGTPSRRPEARSIADALSGYLPAQVSQRTSDSGWRRRAAHWSSRVCRFIATHKFGRRLPIARRSWSIRLQGTTGRGERLPSSKERVLIYRQRHHSRKSILDRCGAISRASIAGCSR